MPALIPQVLSLLDRFLNQTPAAKTSDFGFNIFGKNKPPKEDLLGILIHHNRY
jgi:hypothetical protein